MLTISRHSDHGDNTVPEIDSSCPCHSYARSAEPTLAGLPDIQLEIVTVA